MSTDAEGPPRSASLLAAADALVAAEAALKAALEDKAANDRNPSQQAAITK